MAAASDHRSEHGARIERVMVQEYYGTDSDRNELWFRDGEASAGVFPEYAQRPLVLHDYPASDLERALREIGLSPDDLSPQDHSEGHGRGEVS